MPNKTITLAFDPLAYPDTAKVFADKIAHMFYLAWRPEHLVGDDFCEDCLRLAAIVGKNQPKTEEQLLKCLRGCGWWSQNLSLADMKRFAPEFMPYLLGTKTIGYEVRKKEAKP